MKAIVTTEKLVKTSKGDLEYKIIDTVMESNKLGERDWAFRNRMYELTKAVPSDTRVTVKYIE